MSIQSLSVPSHETELSPTLHTVYVVRVTLSPSGRTYEIRRRYSDFVQLDDRLTKAVGAGQRAPVGLPPKRVADTSSGVLTKALVGIGAAGNRGNSLTDSQKVERRLGLERYLKALVASKDTRWSRSRVLEDFLELRQHRDGTEDGGGAAGQGSGEWTSTGWLNESRALDELTRDTRVKVQQRDKLVRDKSADAHKVAGEVKKDLVSLVTRVGNLAKGLEPLAQQGMAQGELSRRSGIVQRLQDDIEQLGKAVNDGPRIGAGPGTSFTRESPASSKDRQALLSSKNPSSTPAQQPSRVLGARPSGQPQETAETRPLDNSGLMHLQQQYMQDQDNKLDSLTAALRRQRVLGEMIHDELQLHDEVLDEIDKGTDRLKGKIKAADKQIKRL